MARPWQTLEKIDTPDGILELRKRGDRDFLILINNRVLMNSGANRSEIALGELACATIKAHSKPRVLIGGLGMGLTLRASLDSLPAAAEVVVAELNEQVVAWCKGPLAELTSTAVRDPRVHTRVNNVADVIAEASRQGARKFDAVIIDLYEGPHSNTEKISDPFYGSHALVRTASALAPGGIFAVWGEAPDAPFEKRLNAAGFTVNKLRPGRGGLRHVVYIAQTCGK
jgi:spermidine synthase